MFFGFAAIISIEIFFLLRKFLVSLTSFKLRLHYFFNKQLIKLLKWNHDWKSKKKSDMKIPIISSFENIVRFLWEKANLLVAWYCQIWNTCLVIISYDHVCVPWLWFHKKQSCKAISFTALKKVSVNKL